MNKINLNATNLMPEHTLPEGHASSRPLSVIQRGQAEHGLLRRLQKNSHDGSPKGKSNTTAEVRDPRTGISYGKPVKNPMNGLLDGREIREASKTGAEWHEIAKRGARPRFAIEKIFRGELSTETIDAKLHQLERKGYTEEIDQYLSKVADGRYGNSKRDRLVSIVNDAVRDAYASNRIMYTGSGSVNSNPEYRAYDDIQILNRDGHISIADRLLHRLNIRTEQTLIHGPFHGRDSGHSTRPGAAPEITWAALDALLPGEPDPELRQEFVTNLPY